MSRTTTSAGMTADLRKGRRARRGGRLPRRAAVAGALLVAATVAWAAAGDLDTTYGLGGIATVPMPPSARVFAVQSTGRAIVGGADVQAAIVRFDGAGVLDSTFGTSGVARLPGSQTIVLALALDSDAILAGGSTQVTTTKGGKTTTQRMPLLARFDANGGLDTEFGTGGSVVLSVPNAYGQTSIAALAVQPDRRIVVAGEVPLKVKGSSTPQSAWYLARLTSSGALDSTFGSGGYVVYDATKDNDGVAPGALALLPDGRIVAGGFSGSPNYGTIGTQALVARFSTSGALESAVVRSSSSLRVLTVDGSGRVLAGGQRLGPSDGYVTRYTSSSSGLAVDATFGTNGESVVALPGYSRVQVYGGLLVDGAGAITAGLFAQQDATSVAGEVWVCRLTDAGSFDSTFGSGGVTGPIDIATTNLPRGLGFDAAGRVLVGGGAWDGGTGGASVWFVARYASN